MDIFLIFLLSSFEVFSSVLNRLYSLLSPNGRYSYPLYLFFNSLFACCVFGVMSGFRIIIDKEIFLYSIIYACIVVFSILTHLLAVVKGTLASAILFSGIGSLLLPSIAGVIFWQEKATIKLIIAYIFLTAAVSLPYFMNKRTASGNSKSAVLYCFLLMISCGIAGIYSKHISQISRITNNKTSMFFWTNAIMFVIFTTYILIKILYKGKTTEKEVQPMYELKSSISIGAILCIAATTLISNLSSVLNLKILENVPISIASMLKNAMILILSLIPALIFKEKIKKSDIFSIIMGICGLILFFA